MKAADQLPREWLDFEIIMYLTSMPKLTQENGPYIARCPSRRIGLSCFRGQSEKLGSKSTS